MKIGLHLRAVLRERLAEVLQDFVAGMGERHGGLEVVGRLIGADEPAADREGDFLLGCKLGVVGQALERSQPGDRVFVHFGRDFFGEAFGQLAAVGVGNLCDVVVKFVDQRFAAGVFGSVFGQQLADFLQRFAGDVIGGKLGEQIAAELMLPGFGAELDFFQDQFRAELAELRTSCCRSLPLGKGFDDVFELAAGVAVAFAFEDTAARLAGGLRCRRT